MDNQQQSLPRLDGCLTFEADDVRVGGTRVPCHVEQGNVVVVLGDRLRPLTLGERALAISLGVAGLARTVWQLSGGSSAVPRSAEQQAVVEAVALHLAGAANPASLHLSLVVAARLLGDPTAVQAWAATIADDLAAGLAADPAGGSPEAGWTVLDFGPSAETSGTRPELDDPVSVRDALAEALWRRAALPVPPELVETAPGHPQASGPALDPDLAAAAGARAARPSAAPGWTAAAPLPGRVAAATAGQRHAAHAVPADPTGPSAPPIGVGGADANVPTASRFPARPPSALAAPERRAPAAPRAKWGAVDARADRPTGAGPQSGAGWGRAAIDVGEPAGLVLTGIDWQWLRALEGRPAVSQVHDGPGRIHLTGTTDVTGGARPGERPAGAPDEGALIDAALGLSEELAEQLLAAADRRGLA
jgi:hypothetical protein